MKISAFLSLVASLVSFGAISICIPAWFILGAFGCYFLAMAGMLQLETE